MAITFISFNVREIFESRFDLDPVQLLSSLALLIWLPVISLLFIYFLGLFAEYELVFMRMNLGNAKHPLDFRTRMAVIFGFGGRVTDLELAPIGGAAR